MNQHYPEQRNSCYITVEKRKYDYDLIYAEYISGEVNKKVIKTVPYDI